MKTTTAEKAGPKRLGRPVGSGLPPEQQAKPRSVRLTDAQWAKLQSLGTDWLRRQIERAKAA